MGTDAARRCPVCTEPYDTPPADCFRCETPLSSWWAFEDAALSPQPQRGPRLLPIAIAVLVGPLVAAVALRVMTGTAHAPMATVAPVTVAEAPPTAATPAPPTTPVVEKHASGAPAVIAYRVQPGDSLWRVSAALTGDGRNWSTLWPARDPAHPLAVGTVLEVPIR